LAKLLEAALFAASRPLTMDEVCSLDPQAGEGTVRAALSEVRETYATGGHGVELVEIAQGWQFLSRREYAEAVDRAQFGLGRRRPRPARPKERQAPSSPPGPGRRHHRGEGRGPDPGRPGGGGPPRGPGGARRRPRRAGPPPGRAARASRAADVARPQQADRLR